MSCTAYIVYTFHLSLHHANFGQFKAKQFLYFVIKTEITGEKNKDAEIFEYI